MSKEMSFLLTADIDEVEKGKLKDELLKIEIEELNELFDDNDDKVIEKVTDEAPMEPLTATLTALGVAVLSKLIVEVIKKTPKAIKALRKLIKKILEKSSEKSTGPEPPVLELLYRGLVLKFTNPSETHIDKVLDRLIPALEGK